MWFNVVVLGIGFFLLFVAFNPLQEIQTSVLQVNHVGYNGLCILYATLAVSNLGGSIVVTKLGAKASLLVGGACFLMCVGCLSGLTFLPAGSSGVAALYYGSSVLRGIGSALLWTAQSIVVSSSSTATDRGRKNGVFWAIVQGNFVVGGLLVQTLLGSQGERVLYWVFLAVTAAGVLLFFVLRSAPLRSEKQDERVDVLEVLRFFANGAILPLVPLMLVSGIGTVFAFGLEPAALGRPVLGYGLLVFGAGEVGGSLGGGFLLDVASWRLALAASCGAAVGGYVWSAFFGSGFHGLGAMGLLGLGDGCLRTVLFALLARLFPSTLAPAVAFFKMLQSVAAAAAFFYSPYLALHWHSLLDSLLYVAASLLALLLLHPPSLPYEPIN